MHKPTAALFTRGRRWGVRLLLMIADFRNLHGQLQTVARILTGAEQTTVQVYASVFLAAPGRLCHSVHVSVAGAAVVGGRLTGGREEPNQIVKVAEEAAQDHFSTVNCGRKRTFRSLRRALALSGGLIIYTAA